MPIYEYECNSCKKVIEIMQKITSDPETVCPTCGGPLKKLVSRTSFQLKGTGWYVSDYKNNKGNKSDGGSNPAKKSDTTKSEAQTVKDETVKAAPEKSTAKDPASSTSKPGGKSNPQS